MTLKAKLLNALIERNHSIMPMSHVPDGHYEDYDHWEGITTDDGDFMINFYSDGEKFYITAYPDILGADGLWSTDTSTPIRIMDIDVIPV